jgi:hypothetical protein
LPQTSQYVDNAKKKFNFNLKALNPQKNDEQGMKHQGIDLHGLSTIAMMISHHYCT